MITQAEVKLLNQIADNAEEMRKAQKDYFSSRSPEVLHRSKILERQLDGLLEQRKSGVACNTEDMFGGDA